ncbi:MAG: hypothetical protein XD98_0332 [Microgenomates bacterium 39_6]|nr:MAG: hypothetical protein XD98_0332 [Microgenomates bacterium 39_6]
MKKSIVLIIAGALVVIGILVVVARQKPETVIIDEPVTEEMVVDEEEEIFSGSLMDVIARGVPMKCSYEVDGVEYEGLVKGENYRGKVSQNGQTMEIIVIDGYSYIWQEGKTQGMKMAFDADMAEEASDEDTAAFASPDIEYRCFPAVVADSQFSLPEDVSFLDFDQMMNQDQLSEEQTEKLEEMSEED